MVKDKHDKNPYFKHKKKGTKSSSDVHITVPIKISPEQYNQIRTNIDSLQLMNEGVLECKHLDNIEEAIGVKFVVKGKDLKKSRAIALCSIGQLVWNKYACKLGQRARKAAIEKALRGNLNKMDWEEDMENEFGDAMPQPSAIQVAEAKALQKAVEKRKRGHSGHLNQAMSKRPHQQHTGVGRQTDIGHRNHGVYRNKFGGGGAGARGSFVGGQPYYNVKKPMPLF